MLLPSRYLPCVLIAIATFSLPVVATGLPAQAQRSRDTLTLSNGDLSATWSVAGGVLRWHSLTNQFTHAAVSLDGSPFALLPKEGAVLRSSDFKIVGEPFIEPIPTATGTSKEADRVPGRQIRIEFADASGKVHLTWKAELHNGANYVREELTIHPEQPLPLAQIVLVDAPLPDAHVAGQVKGSPVTAGTFFVGFEHPLSECRVRYDRATCWLSRELPVQAGQSVTYSAVFGVSHPGQLRRDFLHYVELERAHPYRMFLHYNSWYDLGYFDRYNEQQAVDVVERPREGQEEVQARHPVPGRRNRANRRNHQENARDCAGPYVPGSFYPWKHGPQERGRHRPRPSPIVRPH